MGSSCLYMPTRRARSRSGRGSAAGFTLIELMITVAIIALLAGIAYPAYTSSVLKGKRAEGRSALLELLQQQERYLTQNGAYLAFAQGATGTPFKTTSGMNPGSAAYELKAEACGSLALNECVLLKAFPRGADAEFGYLTLKSTGEKSCETGNAKCWSR